MKKLPKPMFLVLVTMLTVLLLSTGCSGTKEVEEKVLTVGVDAPLTGPSARSGQEFKYAVEMAFEEVGYKIGDYKVKLVWIDDQSDPEKATRAYEEAIMREKIDAGILNWNSSVASALMEVTAKNKIPHFFASGASEVVNEKWASDDKYKYWVAKAWATPAKMTRAYVDTIEAAIKKGIWTPRNKKVAIYGEDTDWGRSYGKGISNEFKKAGWEIVSEDYFKMGETELYPLLTKLRDADVSVVAGTVSSPPSMAAFIKQAREVKLNSLLISDSLGETGEWYKLTGEASNYILDNRPIFASEKAKKFAADFEAKYGIAPGAAAGGQQYDYTRFFIKLANETLKEYGELNSETLFKFAQEKLWTGQFTFTDGILMEEYKYSLESIPDPVVGEGAYIFPVVQYFNGQGKIIWPDSQKEADLQIPDYLK